VGSFAARLWKHAFSLFELSNIQIKIPQEESNNSAQFAHRRQGLK
jgi:hypothetical protein